MKTIYLTSSLGTYQKNNGIKQVTPLSNQNNFAKNLKKDLKNKKNVLYFPDDIDNIQNNQEKLNIIIKSFNMSNISYLSFTLTTRDNINENLKNIFSYDIIILSGGSLPKENAYFNEYHLADFLKKYNGIIIGESAGSMNMAQNVYICPETATEASNSTFLRWNQGLNLTDINIFPHYNKLYNVKLNNLKMIEDIVLIDNLKNKIYFLNDGTYILLKNNKISIYGECYINNNNQIIKICNDNETIDIQ